MISGSPPPEPEPAPPPRLGAANGQLVAWAALGVLNAATIAGTLPFEVHNLKLRVLHHFYDAGQMLAIGLLCSAAVSAFCRFAPRPRPGDARLRAFLLGPFLDIAAIAAVALALGYPILRDDLGQLAVRVKGDEEGTSSTQILLLLISIVALGVPFAAAVGRLLGRPFFRWIAVAGAVGAGAVNEVILVNSYPGAHLYLAWAAAACGGAAIAGLRVPRWGAVTSRARRAALAARGAVVVAAVVAVVVWPRSAVVLALHRIPGAVLTPFLAQMHTFGGGDAALATLTPESKEWFTDRSRLPDVPPTAPRAAPQDQVIVLVMIDSLRADVLADRRYAKELPELGAIKAQAVDFTQARSPGAQTAYSFTELFDARYFSEMYWTPKDGGALWPHEDTSIRFPELLSRAGIPTVTFATVRWMINEYGVVRGLTEETVLDPETTKVKAPMASEVVDAAIPRLSRQGKGPLFLFLHFMDAHFPYDRAGTSGTEFERYVREVGLIDVQLARLRSAIAERGLAGRTTLIISADHGEAFGEHGTTQHGVTLYEELLRVPLVISSPGAAPRKVDTPVSLLDVGPTILDLMGIPTPATYMGQSLAPFLRGGEPALTRPILAEGRLKQALVFPDKIKVIRDLRRGTIEIYDLERDPQELKDLYDDLGAAGEARVGVLKAFFDMHTLKRAGYTVPYRP